MAINEYLSLRDCADLLGYAVETLRIVIEYGMGPPKARRTGLRPYHKPDVLGYRKRVPFSPNDLIKRDTDPLFAKHDDGRWWPRLTYDEAIRAGARRYFDGTACHRGHRCERFTKNKQCAECSEIKAGRGTKRYLLNQAQNSSTSPG